MELKIKLNIVISKALYCCFREKLYGLIILFIEFGQGKIVVFMSMVASEAIVEKDTCFL